MSFQARTLSTPHTLQLLALASLLAIAGCGGGGGDTTASTTSTTTTTTTTPPATSTVSTAASFPVGLSIGSPGDVAAGAAVSASPVRVALDWGRAAWQALTLGDGPGLQRLALAATPFGEAHAAGERTPGLAAATTLIGKVLDGDTSVSLASVIQLGALFGQGGGNAACYGPSLDYASHQDAGPGPAAGRLPGGDLGLWLATEPGSGEPCAVAQMDRRIDGAKAQGLQALIVAALMRGTVARSNTLAMPAAESSTDLTSALGSVFATALPLVPVTVEQASIALDGAGQYTYRLVLSGGTGIQAKRGEMTLRHAPGASAAAYTGTLQVAGFMLDNDAAFGCTDQVDAGTGAFKVARVSTLKYSRSGSTIEFGSRSASYCGHPDTATAGGLASQVAAFAGDGQLDPAVKISGTAKAASKGWRGNFTRYAAAYDKDSGAGSFLLAWQAGTGDSHARAMAATATASGGARTVKAYYAYAADVATTTGALQGMICNWAGPGNSHVPAASFQSQAATLAAGATTFVLDSSLITYAPTVSCSSTSTQYDVDANGTLAAGEGVGTAAQLDVPAGSGTTVDAEIRSRGYTPPALF